MNVRKRGTEPDEAPNQVNKRPRVQKNTPINDPVPPPNLQESNVVGSGRPGSPSYRVPQVGSHQIPPIQLPPEQLDQSVRARPVLTIDPPQLSDLPGPSQSGPTDPASGRSEASTCYSQRVSKYDVEPSVEPIGRVEEEDLQKWGKVDGAAEFIRSTSGLEGNWVGIRPLGKGGNGIAGLWEFLDENGQLTKQMVVKEETYTKEEWKRRRSIQRVPGEVKAMSKLNKVGCYAIPRLFNYKRYPTYHKHRMYMEFCEFKDLSVLCDMYRGFRQFLPEPFLWDTFYHLVEAAVAMRDGPGKGEWGFEIVHRDLKPGNVFLASENEEKGFPFYPVAKTGDFGLAVMTNLEDPFNPHYYQGPGTEGYYADEQFVSYKHLPREEHQRLSSHTNVWAIGATMFELLTLYAHVDYMDDKAFSKDGYIVDFTTVKDPEYSQDLRDLIQDCLHPIPRSRIRLDVLRIYINAYRSRTRDRYEQSNDDEKARFKAENRLYYVKNEINNMPPGNWEPYFKKKRPDSEQFPETARIRYPLFSDGSEPGADDGDGDDGDGDDGDGDDGDGDDGEADYGDEDDGDEDDDDDDEAGPPGVMQPKATVPPPRGRRRRERQNVTNNDRANKRTDDASIRPPRRARRVPHPQLRRENAIHETPDAGAVDGDFGDGGWFINGRDFRHGRLGDLLEDDMLDDGADEIPQGEGAGGGDIFEERLEDSVADGMVDDGMDGDGRDGDGTDDGSRSMDVEVNDPPSPSPAPTQFSPPTPPPPPPPPPPPSQPAPHAPVQAPALQPPVQPATRRLRNGKLVPYF